MPAKDKHDREDDGPEAGTAFRERPPAAEPDVYLDVPQVDVDELVVDVEDLRARVSLSVEVLDLVRLNVGADVALGKVHLDLKGVHAQAVLKVRLDRVTDIVERVLATVDRNPQILEQTLSAVERTVGPVAEGGRKAVETVGEDVGETVEAVPPAAERVAKGVTEGGEEDGGERQPRQRAASKQKAAGKRTAKKAAKKAAGKRSS